jgi:hypothetical protein
VEVGIKYAPDRFRVPSAAEFACFACNNKQSFRMKVGGQSATTTLPPPSTLRVTTRKLALAAGKGWSPLDGERGASGVIRVTLCWERVGGSSPPTNCERTPATKDLAPWLRCVYLSFPCPRGIVGSSHGIGSSFTVKFAGAGVYKKNQSCPARVTTGITRL